MNSLLLRQYRHACTYIIRHYTRLLTQRGILPHFLKVTRLAKLEATVGGGGGGGGQGGGQGGWLAGGASLSNGGGGGWVNFIK